jgi:hypothetical protein
MWDGSEVIHVCKSQFIKNVVGVMCFAPFLVNVVPPKSQTYGRLAIVLQLGVDGSISLISLGADGRRGGSGVEADIIGTFDPKAAPDTPWIVDPFPFRRYPDTSSTHP